MGGVLLPSYARNGVDMAYFVVLYMSFVHLQAVHTQQLLTPKSYYLLLLCNVAIYIQFLVINPSLSLKA